MSSANSIISLSAPCTPLSLSANKRNIREHHRMKAVNILDHSAKTNYVYNFIANVAVIKTPKISLLLRNIRWKNRKFSVEKRIALSVRKKKNLNVKLRAAQWPGWNQCPWQCGVSKVPQLHPDNWRNYTSYGNFGQHFNLRKRSMLRRGCLHLHSFLFEALRATRRKR